VRRFTRNVVSLSFSFFFSPSSPDTLGGARVSWVYSVVYVAVSIGLLFQAYIGVKTARSSKFYVAVSVCAALMGLCVPQSALPPPHALATQDLLCVERVSLLQTRSEDLVGLLHIVVGHVLHARMARGHLVTAGTS
jgi:hypothetical protein